MEILIISLFTAFYLYDDLTLYLRVGKLLKWDDLHQTYGNNKENIVVTKIMHALRCKKCFTWWVSVVVTAIYVCVSDNTFYLIQDFTTLVPAMAAFVIVSITEKL